MMVTQQELYLNRLRHYIADGGLQILQERDIDHGYQLRISNGTERCVISAYHSGKVVVGGKKGRFSEQMQEWTNLQLAEMTSSLEATTRPAEPGQQSHATKYIVAAEKYDKIRLAVEQLPVQIGWREASANHEVYKADIRAEGNRVMLTQFQTGTLLVQGKASPLLDQVCELLDTMLVQSPADHAMRYVPEEQANQVMVQMERPEAEAEAWNWLEKEIGNDVLNFLPQHDQNTLVAGAMLLEAARTLQMPDYSPLVMPFARAYEGFLIQLCMHIGLVCADDIEKDLRAIRVGAWLDEIPKLLVNPRRDGHIQSDLKTAWEGTRHLMLHSDPSRQTAMPTYEKAVHEICGVLMRAFDRGYSAFVRKEIPIKEIKEPTQSPHRGKGIVAEGSKHSERKRETDAITVTNIDETVLVTRFQNAGYDVEMFDDPQTSTKWRVETPGWKVFFPREPGSKVIIRGAEREKVATWIQDDTMERPDSTVEPLLTGYIPHIGADEAGKGDYFGPLVTAAVYVESEAQMDLIRWGVRDSKSMSDSTISELALKIRERCPNVVEILMPADYNVAYEEEKNLNRLLAALHAKGIEQLVQITGCHVILVDQFAAESVLEQALAQSGGDIQLTQRTKGESDIAVAAASILAREAFVAAIEDFRVKSEIKIPLGASSPDIIRVGKTIVRKWGREGLKRIAKVDFRTTRKIVSG